MGTTRRQFLYTGCAAGAWALTAPAASYRRILGANAGPRLAVIGVRGRGNDHLAGFGDRVVAICDCDAEWLDRRSQEFAERTGRQLDRVADFRNLVERRDIDAVSVATPNHTHALVTIVAAMAGKHVFVEKPISHNVWEGRQIVRAAERWGVVLACGLQCRSSPALAAAVEFVRQSKLGPIQHVVGTCYKPRKSIGRRREPLPIPATLDFDLWCGPAEERPIYRDQLHYDWHWDFLTGNGDMGNQGVHQMDIACWFLDARELPTRAVSVGGRVGYEDAGDTPNTQVVLYEFGSPDERPPLVFETRGLPRSKEFQSDGWEKNMDSLRGVSIGVVVECRDGYVVVPSYTQATAYHPDGSVAAEWNEGADHYAGFVAAVEAGDSAGVAAPPAIGHIASALCHVGNISHRAGHPTTGAEIRDASLGAPLFGDACRRMLDHLAANEVDADAGGLILGEWLDIDPERETITNSPRARSMLTRTYREPYRWPELVGASDGS
jgi:predicted dehydrogenase